MNNILKKYNVIGDDFFCHHTASDSVGEIYYHGPEVHRQYEVLYLINGEISYIIEGKTYDVSPGDIIFVSPNEIHTLKINGSLAYERAVILFDMSVIDKLSGEGESQLELSKPELSRRLRIIDKDTAARHGLQDIIVSIVEETDSEPYRRLKVIAGLIEFIIRLDKIAKEGGRKGQTPNAVDPLMQRINNYIDAHISEPITLDGMAKELFVSKSTLCHRFASHMNMTLNRYIAVKKIYRADALMRDGLSASRVCREVGYDNYTSFYYNYRQIMGKPPSGKLR